MKSRSGMSLVETMLGVFVLLAVFVMFATLFQWVLTSSKRGDQQATAARLASNRLAELRDWAAQPNGARDNFHSSWASLATAVEMEPGYLVSVNQVSAQIYSPSTQLESAYPNPREMSQACKRVQIRVQWGTQSYELYSQLTAPPVIGQAINLTLSSTATIAFGSGITLTAQGVDTNNQEIDDLVYQWNVLPITGSGSIRLLDRNGRRAEFRNDDPATRDGSQLRVEVSATYRGKLLRAESSVITEDGP